jgi:hypothetical protein
MTKDATITIRISAEDKEELEKDARRQERSVANLLLRIWRSWKESPANK